jgi:nucleotide-binding universal stress UspA family protein
MYGRIVAAITGADSSIEIVRVAHSLSTPSTKLTLLHVVKKLNEASKSKATKDLARSKKESEGMPGCSNKMIVANNVGRAIVDFAKNEQADLVVIGFSSSLIGNISKFVINNSPCTVILVRKK